MAKQHSKVAAYISAAVDASEKTQAQIADEAGFNKSNIISMLKMGITKMPIARIPAFAKAVDCDPVELYRLCMEEYMPDMLKVTDDIYGRDKLNTGETELLKILRAKTGGKSFRLNGELRDQISDLGAALAK